MKRNTDFEDLLKQYINGTLSERDKLALEESLALSDNEELVRALIKKTFDDTIADDLEYDQGKVDKMVQTILQNSAPMDQPEHRFPLGSGAARGIAYRRLNARWIRYAAAAVVAGVTLFYATDYLTTRQQTGRASLVSRLPAKEDIIPGANKAVLTLSNGNSIVLNDDAHQVITDDKAVISNDNGTVSYNNSANSALNTMTTPNGGQYKLNLSDGTRVWLNAASSITFPASFLGNKREVSITGEVYFEVAKDAAKPFIVKTYRDDITVLGTAFNVNSYTDETSIKTTLLEGLVKVNNTLVKPGNAYASGEVAPADMEKDLAWRNGVFNFHHVKLTEAMRQISRWYDVNVRYENKIKNIELGGEIGRNLTLQQLLNGLQNIDIHFRLEGKTVVVI